MTRPSEARTRSGSVPVLLVVLVASLAMLPTVASAASESLSIFPDPLELLILIAVFVAMIFPVHKILFQPLLGVLDERGKRIEGARARAEEIDQEAGRVFGEYQTAVSEARKLAEEDRRGHLETARREQSRVTSEARGSAEEEVQRARAGVADALAQARVDLRGQAEELAREAAGRVLGRSLS